MCDLTLVEAILRIAEALELSVVAEGIETAEQLSMLRSMGCTYGQGHLLGYPMPVGEALRQLREGVPNEALRSGALLLPSPSDFSMPSSVPGT